jgi:hypothetical protein
MKIARTSAETRWNISQTAWLGVWEMVHLHFKAFQPHYEPPGLTLKNSTRWLNCDLMCFQSKQGLLPYTSLTVWFSQARRSVYCAVRTESISSLNGKSVRLKANFLSVNLTHGMYNIRPGLRLGIVFFCSRSPPTPLGWQPGAQTCSRFIFVMKCILFSAFVGSRIIIIKIKSNFSLLKTTSRWASTLETAWRK